MTEMLARIDGGLVDMVIVTKLDRPTRSVKDLSLLLERFAKSRRADGDKGIDIISTADSLDTSTATGRMVIGTLGVIAQWERDIFSERTIQALGEMRAQDRFTGQPRYGYKGGKNGKVRGNAKEMAALSRIMELREEGKGWSIIALTLTKEGIRKRKGTAFSRQDLHQMAKRAGLR